MRSRHPTNEQIAEVTRRRLELLSAELAGLRPVPLDPRPSSGWQEPGEPADPPGPADPLVRADPRDEPARTAVPLQPGRHARRPGGVARRLAGWLHDRLPPSLQGRVRLGTSQLTVVALLVGLALAASAWFVLRADQGGTAVPARPRPAAAGQVSGTGRAALLVTPAAGPVTGPGGSSPTPGAGASVTPAELVVDVAGKVRHPGIVTLPAGARVVDALRAAGGVRRRVDLSALNLARPLSDGEQILVGLPQPAGVAAPAASAAGSATPLVNLNTATEPELESLPGVGPVTAAAILKWRSENGPFTAVDQLLDVSGIGDATLAEIAPFVTL